MEKAGKIRIEFSFLSFKNVSDEAKKGGF